MEASRTFLLLLSYGCSGCADISSKLADATLDGWSLVVVMGGHPIPESARAELGPNPRGMAADGGFGFPPQARVIHDRDRRILKALGTTATPTALALVAGKLVDQDVAPNIDWFREVQRKRAAKGEELLVARR